MATEHGPYGGDEINKIEFGGNYGFPIVSVGDQYKFEQLLNKRLNYSFQKDHAELGFKEPIFSFLKSIGISELIYVPNEFSKYWKDNFLVSSLNGRSLYRFKFDKNFTKVEFYEKIYIGERIRDLKYFENKDVVLMALEETGSLGILKTK